MCLVSTAVVGFDVPNLCQALQMIRNLSPDDLSLRYEATIPLERHPTIGWGVLCDNDTITVKRVCLLAWAVTSGTQVPRELQLRAFLAIHHGRDSLFIAGTGSGKTLPIALTVLLDNPTENHLSIVISPLKRLQISQENDFNAKYHISTIAINDDTPRDQMWWKANIHDIAARRPGKIQLIITTAEQLFKTPEGHTPRLANLLRENQFQQRIKRIHIDEAHSIHITGLSRHGIAAFRPAWGKLDELKVLLPTRIPWQAMTATLPTHMQKTVEQKILRPGYITIRSTSNRPNTIYATHCVPTDLGDPRNYSCFLCNPFAFKKQPRVLIFFDNKTIAASVALYLDSQLPLDFQCKGVVRHYHSEMSEEYLQKVHSSFIDADGCCKILCATSAESVGVDFPDVEIVCNAGLPNIVEILQRGGRVGRRDGDLGLFVIFYEHWVLNICLENFKYGDADDPDRPCSFLKPTSQVRDRITYSSVALLQSKCLRKFFATYLNDDSPNALDFWTEFCCSHHCEIMFDIAKFLLGPLFELAAPTATKRKAGTVYRPIPEREILDQNVIKWLKDSSENDPLRGVRTIYDILSIPARRKLVSAAPGSVRSSEAIISLLEETPEWGEEWSASLLEVIAKFDCDLASQKVAGKRAKRLK